MESQLTARQRNDIDRHLGFLATTIGQNVAPGFGSLQRVAAGAGRRSWRESFCALLESVLRDAEDMFVHLPYAEIRHELARLSSALDEVTLPRLVVAGFGRPSHVLLDETSKQVSGVVDFSSAFWGDVLMAELFENPNTAVLEGAGMPSTRTKREDIRLLMYVSRSIPALPMLSLLTYLFSSGTHAIGWSPKLLYNTIERETRRRNLTRDGD
jgi:hypothetical protein